ncbi:hypothetical protein Tco_1040143 [Tanacetum coccineum]
MGLSLILGLSILAFIRDLAAPKEIPHMQIDVDQMTSLGQPVHSHNHIKASTTQRLPAVKVLLGTSIVPTVSISFIRIVHMSSHLSEDLRNDILQLLRDYCSNVGIRFWARFRGLFLMLCDLDFEPLSLCLCSLPSCDLMSFDQHASYLCIHLEALNQRLVSGSSLSLNSLTLLDSMSSLMLIEHLNGMRLPLLTV